MKFGVVVFPAAIAITIAGTPPPRTSGIPPKSSGTIRDRSGDVDAVILPGGFSYGDYLRCGAIAKFSPVMTAVKQFAADGGLVLGICNGFQILVEAGLLPGALVRNREPEVHLPARWSCGWRPRIRPSPPQPKRARCCACRSRTAKAATIADEHTLDELEAEDRVAFRYVDNPNGSLRDIAGILNRERNVWA